MVTIAEHDIPNWHGPQENVTLRLFALNDFIFDDDQSVVANDEQVYQEIECNYAGGTLTIDEADVIPTVSSITNPWAKYRAVFYEDGTESFEWPLFRAFRLDSNPASTTWPHIAVYNRPAPPIPTDYVPYTREQVNYLLGLTFSPVTITPGATSLDVSNTLFFKTANVTPTTLSTFTGGSTRHLVVIEFGDSVTTISGFARANLGDIFLGYWSGTTLIPISMTFLS